MKIKKKIKKGLGPSCSVLAAGLLPFLILAKKSEAIKRQKEKRTRRSRQSKKATMNGIQGGKVPPKRRCF